MLIEQIKNIMDKYGKFMVASIQDRLIKDNTNATGSAIQSVSYRATESGLEILGNKYISAIDEGRGAGKKMPPISNILQWIKSRGITQMSSTKRKMRDRDLAFVIARKIAREGTIKRFGNRGTGLLQFVIDKNLQPFADDLTEVMEQQISIIAQKVQKDVNKN